MSSSRRYSAFVDLVGTRDLAKDDTTGYWSALKKFQEALYLECSALSPRSSISFFSDCAFIEAETFAELTRFLRAIRLRLLQDRCFFKAAVKQGDLKPQPAASHPNIKRVDERRKNILRGYWFSEHAADLYVKQEQLKGIGIWVNPDESAVAEHRQFLELSCHIPESSRREAVVYTDLRLNDADMTKGNLHGVLRTFFEAKTRSRRYGRYYISLMVLWAQSVPLATVRFNPRSDSDLVNLILSGRFYQLFADVVGIENVFFALLNRVHKENNVNHVVFETTKRYVLGNKRLLSALHFVPTAILSTDVRRQCLGTVSDTVLNRYEIIERALERIKAMIATGKRPGEIARSLDDEGIAPPSGRSWHANTVISILRQAGGQ